MRIPFLSDWLCGRRPSALAVEAVTLPPEEWVLFGTIDIVRRDDSFARWAAVYTRARSKEAEARSNGFSVPIDYEALIQTGKVIKLSPFPSGF